MNNNIYTCLLQECMPKTVFQIIHLRILQQDHVLTNQQASFWQLCALSMAQAGSFCAVLLFVCALLAASEFPVHITSTMWSIDDILKPPQTRALNILPTPPPSPSVPPATFVYHTLPRAPGDTLKQIQRLSSNLSTPPPSPRVLPAPYV